MGIFSAFFPLKNLMNHHESPWFLFAVFPHSKWRNPPLFNNRFRGGSPRFTTPPCGVSGTSCSWYCRDPWRSPWIKNLPISRNSQDLVSSCKFSNYHITDIIQHVTWPWHTVTYGGFLGSIHLRWFNPRPEAIRWLVHKILATKNSQVKREKVSVNGDARSLDFLPALDFSATYLNLSDLPWLFSPHLRHCGQYTKVLEHLSRLKKALDGSVRHRCDTFWINAWSPGNRLQHMCIKGLPSGILT